MKFKFLTKLYLVFALTFFIFIGSTMADSNIISRDEAWTKIKAGALLVDVRTPDEYQTHLEGAINIPYDNVRERLAEFGEDKNKVIVLYCKSGKRSGIAQEVLKDSGFTNVFNAGGYADLEK